MPKRFALFFDGTWNTPDDSSDHDGSTNTNVVRMHRSVVDKGADGRTQVAKYFKGVGTEWWNRVRGGAFGVGLSENVKEGYRFLVRHWSPGDEIFLFGFSRGAYTARSLGGMIRNCGILKPASVKHVDDAHQLYRARDEGADSAHAKEFRSRFARETRIKCIGVWDTVGALGIPIENFGAFSRRFHEFHDVGLSGIVENAFHAVAIDERRENYRATMWDATVEPGQRVEQVWFVGAHSNVGGGYRGDRLADASLRWMQERAVECGLSINTRRLPQVTDDVIFHPVRDSYAEFLKGIYQRFKSPFHRPIGFTKANEAVDVTVRRRLEGDPRYRIHNRVAAELADQISRIGPPPAGPSAE